jgi:mannose-6-phosphate isomerase
MAKNAQNHEERPWGNFTVLNEIVDGENKDVIIKRLEVHPGKRLSYQTHKLRHEHWFVLSGDGSAIINDLPVSLTPGKSVQIGVGDKHRLDNSSGSTPLVVIEIITGEFDEYDNERIEDDFNRDSSWRNSQTE